ncbi:hypothetical protein ACFY7C_19600 [Streptomyces sp. NPDC012769]|uniref:hypothetical protein n=1 Tax=Streptomyces sp. NPDC012769 TaxID=3364848 RepID=UPI0036CB025A
MSDEMEFFAPRPNLEEVVKRGDYRESLMAMRDFVAHELEGNRCKTCHMTQMRTGELSALVLRLQKLIEDIVKIPENEEEVDEFDRLIAREPDWASAPPDFPPPPNSR